MDGDGVSTGEEPGAAPLHDESRLARVQARLRRFRGRLRTNPVLDTAWRVGIFVVGWLVVLAGVVMLAIPGPGWGSIFLGFAILATEFVWARRALRKAKKVAVDVTERALDPKVRRRNQILAGGLLAAAILVVGIYLGFFGVPEFVPFVGGAELR